MNIKQLLRKIVLKLRGELGTVDADLQTAKGDISSLQSGKVDKVTGKQLSTNDYTTAEKNKLSNIEAGAEVNTVTSVAGKTGAVTLVKSDVGLGNVDNTSDASKPVSTAQQTALNAKADKSTTYTKTEVDDNFVQSEDDAATEEEADANFESITVAEDSTFNAGVQVKGNLNVNEQLHMGGSIYLHNQDIYGASYIEAASESSNTIAIEGNLDVNGDVDIEGDTNINSSLIVNGTINCGDELDLNGYAISNAEYIGLRGGELEIDGDVQVDGGVTVASRINFYDEDNTIGLDSSENRISVTGDTHFNDNISLGGSLSLSSAGDIYMNEANMLGVDTVQFADGTEMSSAPHLYRHNICISGIANNDYFSIIFDLYSTQAGYSDTTMLQLIDRSTPIKCWGYGQPIAQGTEQNFARITGVGIDSSDSDRLSWIEPNNLEQYNFSPYDSGDMFINQNDDFTIDWATTMIF